MAIVTASRRSIPLLLAALTLATGLLPPALGHSHLDGERPHRHQGDHDHQHRHTASGHDGIAREHLAEHHRESTPVVAPLGRLATAHLHIYLGAFGLTIPSPCGSPERLGHPAQDDLAIGVADDGMAPTRIDTPRLPVPSPGSLAVARVDAAPPLPSVPRLAATRGSSPRLCDAARQERSGVLRT